MKHFLVMLSALMLCLASCTTDGNSENRKSNSKFSKNIDLPLNPCDYITRETVLSHFEISSNDLELKDDNNTTHSQYSQCGYIWRKSNYDEIEAMRTDMMMAYASKGMNKNGKEVKLSDLTKLESPSNLIKIGHFRKYDNNSSAVRSFKNSHRVPSKEDIKKLHKEIDKQGTEKGLDEKSKKLGKGLSGGIGSSLKFTEVDGVGDKAFFDHLNRSLDVRYGDFSFSVFIDTELDFEANMEIAKKVAEEVWGKL